MYKYLPALLALFLCACSHSKPVAKAPVAPVKTAMTVELADSDVEQALTCTDDLDCLKQLTGFCANGYSGSRSLRAENNRIVGVLFHCVTNEEKAEAAEADAAQERNLEALRAQLAARAAERQKKQSKKK